MIGSTAVVASYLFFKKQQIVHFYTDSLIVLPMARHGRPPDTRQKASSFGVPPRLYLQFFKRKKKQYFLEGARESTSRSSHSCHTEFDFPVSGLQPLHFLKVQGCF